MDRDIRSEDAASLSRLAEGVAIGRVSSSGIEIALWDLAGKRAKQPVWQLLGGPARKELDTYASLLCYTEPALVAQNVSKAASQGYRFIKLHEVTREATLAATGQTFAQVQAERAELKVTADPAVATPPPARVRWMRT